MGNRNPKFCHFVSYTNSSLINSKSILQFISLDLTL